MEKVGNKERLNRCLYSSELFFLSLYFENIIIDLKMCLFCTLSMTKPRFDYCMVCQQLYGQDVWSSSDVLTDELCYFN